MNPYPQPSQEAPFASSYRLDLLREIPAAVAEAFRRHGVKRSLADGVTLVQRGQSMGSVLIVLRGKLRSVTSLPDGREHLLRWVEPGEAVGVASALARLPFQADLIASGRCEVLAIPATVFIEAMRHDAEVSLAVARLLAVRLSEMFDHVVVQAEVRLQDRLRATLDHLALENGETTNDGRIRLQVSQQDLGDAVGASRQRVNEALQALQQAGLVELGYRQITLPARNSIRTGKRKA